MLHERWSDWFEGLRIEVVGDATIISGLIADVSALHAILDKIRDLGLTVISVRRFPPMKCDPDPADGEATSQGTAEDACRDGPNFCPPREQAAPQPITWRPTPH